MKIYMLIFILLLMPVKLLAGDGTRGIEPNDDDEGYVGTEAKTWNTGAINNMSVTTMTFSDNTVLTSTAGLGGASEWVGTATSDLSMAGFGIVGVSTIQATAYNIPTKRMMVSSPTSGGVNQAIDALGANGGEVYVPVDNTIVTTRIDIDSNYTKLCGGGLGTHLDASGWATDHTISGNGMDYITIEGLRITGSGSGSKDLINTTDTDYSTFKNLLLLNAHQHALYLVGGSCDYNLIQNVVNINSRRHGIYVHGSYNRILGNYSDTAGTDGVGINILDTYNILANNMVVGCSLNGIYTSSNYVNISNNLAKSNSGYGIGLSGANYTTVCNNYAEASGKDGMYSLNGDYNNYVGNILRANGNNYSGISLNSCDFNSLVSNISYGGSGKEEYALKLTDCNYNSVIGLISNAHDSGGIYEDTDSHHNQYIFPMVGSETAPFDLNGSSWTLIWAKDGNIAIGTTTAPTEKLVVYGTIVTQGAKINGEFASLGITDNATSTQFTLNDSSGSFEGNITVSDDKYIGISGAERIIFDSNGNDIELMGADVGIGTTSPRALLHVFRNSGANAELLIENDWNSTDANAFLILDKYNSTAESGVILKHRDDEKWRLSMTYDGADYNLGLFDAGGTPNMYWLQNGNVGIGDITPDESLLVVNGTITAQGFVQTCHIPVSNDYVSMVMGIKAKANQIGLWQELDHVTLPEGVLVEKICEKIDGYRIIGSTEILNSPPESKEEELAIEYEVIKSTYMFRGQDIGASTNLLIRCIQQMKAKIDELEAMIKP